MDGSQIVAVTEIAPRLPSEPDFGQLESFSMQAFNPLEEDARQTLNGVIANTNRAAELIALALRAFWTARRADPDLVPQPVRQFSKPTPCGFAGYDPNPERFAMDAAIVNPTLYARLLRAGHKERTRWR